jgi:hypothetical protein
LNLKPDLTSGKKNQSPVFLTRKYEKKLNFFCCPQPSLFVTHMRRLTTRKWHKVGLRRMFTKRQVKTALRTAKRTLLDVRVVAYLGWLLCVIHLSAI